MSSLAFSQSLHFIAFSALGSVQHLERNSCWQFINKLVMKTKSSSAAQQIKIKKESVPLGWHPTSHYFTGWEEGESNDQWPLFLCDVTMAACTEQPAGRNPGASKVSLHGLQSVARFLLSTVADLMPGNQELFPSCGSVCLSCCQSSGTWAPLPISHQLTLQAPCLHRSKTPL